MEEIVLLFVLLLNFGFIIKIYLFYIVYKNFLVLVELILGNIDLLQKVNKISHIQQIIVPHFNNYPLQTQKRIDFELWCQVIQIISEKKHWTQDGFLKILSISSIINRGLSSKLKSLFPNIEKLKRPIYNSYSINPNWLSGFITGEGNFSIKIIKRINNKSIKHQIETRFIITQHIRDKILFEKIIIYLGCGKFYVRSNGLACDLVVYKLNDNFNKIIPFFNQY